MATLCWNKALWMVDASHVTCCYPFRVLYFSIATLRYSILNLFMTLAPRVMPVVNRSNRPIFFFKKVETNVLTFVPSFCSKYGHHILIHCGECDLSYLLFIWLLNGLTHLHTYTQSSCFQRISTKLYCFPISHSLNIEKGRGGGQVVSVLAFYSVNPIITRQ